MCSRTGHRDVNIHLTSLSGNYSQQWGYSGIYWCLTPWGLFRVPPTKSDILVVPGTGCDSRTSIQLRKNTEQYSHAVRPPRSPSLQAPSSTILTTFVLVTASRPKYVYGRHSVVLINDRLHVQPNKAKILYIQCLTCILKFSIYAKTTFRYTNTKTLLFTNLMQNLCTLWYTWRWYLHRLKHMQYTSKTLDGIYSTCVVLDWT